MASVPVQIGSVPNSTKFPGSVQDGGVCCEKLVECDHLPDACTNDIREEKLMERQAKNDGRSCIHRLLARDRNLIIACVIVVVALNTTTGRYLLYPFMIFSTWVHEMCHGLAAILMGGYISKLEIFQDGSGLAWTSVSGTNRKAIVSSAGYVGTAIMGCVMLLFRRTTLGPTIGTIAIGLGLVLSVAFWVRNTFGVVCLLVEGFVLALLGWKLPAAWLDHLYNFLAATCALNAVDSIKDLFSLSTMYVNGEEITSSDAHSVADRWGMTYLFWATCWLWFSFIMTGIGIVFALDAREVPACLKDNTVDTTTTATGGSTIATAPPSIFDMSTTAPISSISNNNNRSMIGSVFTNNNNNVNNNDSHYYENMVGSAVANTNKNKKKGWKSWLPGRKNKNKNTQQQQEQQLPVAYAVAQLY